MKLAIDKVRHKEMSARAEADTFPVPRSSLVDRLTKLKEGEMVKLTSDMGWFQRTFTDELEEKLVSHIKDLDSRHMPLTGKEFCIFAYKLAENLKIPHRFNKNKCAGKQFYYEFLRRHPELSLRTSESTSLQRAVGFKSPQVGRFFFISWNKLNLNFHPLQK
jgi:hypothetical protein